MPDLELKLRELLGKHSGDPLAEYMLAWLEAYNTIGGNNAGR